MALFDSADLLARLRLALNRPTSDEAMSDADCYSFLTEAQQDVAQRIAFECPEEMYGALTLLTTADSGATYTFGTDADAAAICPMGRILLLASKTGPEIPPGDDNSGSTSAFIFEDDKIRWPGAKTRTFADGPYARFVTPPGLLSAAVAPVIPKPARGMLPYKAAAMAASLRLGLNGAPFEEEYEKRWFTYLATAKTKYRSQTSAAGQGGQWFDGLRR